MSFGRWGLGAVATAIGLVLAGCAETRSSADAGAGGVAEPAAQGQGGETGAPTARLANPAGQARTRDQGDGEAALLHMACTSASLHLEPDGLSPVVAPIPFGLPVRVTALAPLAAAGSASTEPLPPTFARVEAAMAPFTGRQGWTSAPCLVPAALLPAQIEAAVDAAAQQPGDAPSPQPDQRAERPAPGPGDLYVLGRRAMAQFSPAETGRPSRQPVAQARRGLQAMAERLTRAGLVPYAYRPVAVELLEDGRPGILSAPGGMLLITTGLLEAAPQADERAFLLARALAHRDLGHGFAGLARGQTLSGDAARQLAARLTDGHDGDLEARADLVAVLTMARAGYNPVAAASVLARAPEFGAAVGRGGDEAQRLASMRRRLASARPVAGLAAPPLVAAATPSPVANLSPPQETGLRDRGGAYTLLLGLFADPSNAERLAASLRAHGHSPVLIPSRSRGRPATAVRLGRYASVAEAEAALRALAGLIPADSLAVRF